MYRCILAVFTYTQNANMADHSVGARDELNESEASQASRKVSLSVVDLGPFVLPSLRVFVFLNATATEWNLPQQRKCFFFQFLRSRRRGNQRDGG